MIVPLIVTGFPVTGGVEVPAEVAAIEIDHSRIDGPEDVRSLGIRSAGEAGQPTRDLRLPHPGRADQDDVLRHDLVAEIVRELPTSPAVSNCDGDGAFGVVLAYDIAIQFGNDFSRGKVCHLMTSTAIWSLV